MADIKLVEVARSFSYKHNLGNYQSCDFFCSQKAECLESEAEEVSEKLYQFCKEQVIKSLNDYISLQIDMTGKETHMVSDNPGGQKPVKTYEAKPTDPWRKKYEHVDVPLPNVPEFEVDENGIPYGEPF